MPVSTFQPAPKLIRGKDTGWSLPGKFSVLSCQVTKKYVIQRTRSTQRHRELLQTRRILKLREVAEKLQDFGYEAKKHPHLHVVGSTSLTYTRTEHMTARLIIY